MQILPIGEQNFRKIREEDMLYVDKTEHIHRLITGGRYYFFSRPRRFGKSLTLSTIAEIFRGNRQIFEGLWIEKNWDWTKTHPVVSIPFNRIGYSELGLEQALIGVILENAKQHGIALEAAKPGLMLRELILKLAEAQTPAVLLIDEYDKPLIDYLEKEDLHIAKAHRKILKAFYGTLKDSESQAALRLLLITGVSKFSQVSIFSDLNYLTDITLHKQFAQLVGYSQAELEHNFTDYILQTLRESDVAETREQLLEAIRDWYNGYSWDGVTSVYNPFSILLFFSHQQFQNFWFKTGTPTFLIRLLKERHFFNFHNVRVSEAVFESYDLENLETRSLLFQTGYLTIKKIEPDQRYILGYPNREVEAAMYNHLIAAFGEGSPLDSSEPVFHLRDALYADDLEQVIRIVNSLFKNIPSLHFARQSEFLYHALLHLTFHYLGVFIDSEVHTSDGRIDAVVHTPNRIYLLEFKLDESADAALRQIREKGYAEKYRLHGKPIIGVGINFSSAKKAVDDWTQEVL